MLILYKILSKIETYYAQIKVTQLKRQFKKCGDHIVLSEDVRIWSPSKLEIGDNSHINPFTFIFAGGGVKIGANTLISCNCSISSVTHLKNASDRTKELEFSPVFIGDNVWIGMGVIVLPGVTIGHNSIIGAGSIVTKDVPENSIFYGVAAQKNGEVCIK